MSREPSKPDLAPAADAGDANLWAGDADGADGAVLVAQSSPLTLDLSAAGLEAAAVDGLGMEAHGYDGHVPLVLDGDVLANIDAALDQLTVSSDLFDVHALDATAPADDSGST